ncbi:hypothetical protein Cs7R123_65350 [Catellatospora sp. TT07R-123]|uniref:hypothetical protein n=1 Tax=Catellatospora sp. TT07R-123 TaxID=2733863 RepID=UPI001B174B16|nr:hypothetical protein [Catellatospora sp. TT07R-123]GHJ49193.1 hypothetical protein Cs7R123_65350 [Catellatospora sp. TT07R-123]
MAPLNAAVIKGEFVAPVRTVFTEQPEIQAVCTFWGAFDVPRMWDSVRTEDDPDAWKQVQGWESLGQLLAEHHDRLAGMRNSLIEVWDPARSRAADEFFKFLDKLIDTMGENAYASVGNARGLDGVLTALKTAKEKVSPLKEQWDSVTSDWLPEWWDHAAGKLNDQARQAMTDAETAVADHRRRMIIPQPYEFREAQSRPRDEDDDDDDSPHGGGPETHRIGKPAGPPPVPGHHPVMPGSPELEGLPDPVPAVPGSPVSVLPVPPGNRYAPGGGAYVLPGPGVGRGGWIAPMPSPGGLGSAQAGATAGRGAAGTGMMPIASPVGGPGQQGARGSGREGRKDVIWQVGQGVPPVIEGAPRDPGPASRDEMAAVDESFVDWFAGVATPWSDDLKVKITRRAE